MEKPSTSEQRRLQALKSLRILDTPPEEIFDRLTQLASLICETPMAVLSLIDEDRQWFKSVVGVDFCESNRKISFCSHTIQSDTTFIVSDARINPLFKDNPLVINDPRIVFYAGAPIISQEGITLGALAVMDYAPRALTQAQISVLEMLADQAMMHMELRLQHDELKILAAERDQMNSALRRQTEHLKKAQKIAETGSWEYRLQNGQIIWSEEVYRIFGVDRDDFGENAESFMSFVHPEDRPGLLVAVEQAIQARSPLDLEHRIIRPNGEVRHVYERGELLIDENGQRILAGTIQDMTVRRATQEQLRLLKTCVARLNDVIMVTEAEPLDEPGPRIVFVNDAFERVTGHNFQEVVGKSPRLLQGPKTQRAELDKVRLALQQYQPICVEIINYTKDGKEFWVEIDIAPVSDATGRVTHFVAVQRDVTVRKQRMAQLANTNRALQMLTRCNEALVRIEEEQELLEQICRLAVDIGGYQLAFVGYKQNDAAHSVRKIASAVGDINKAVLDETQISWSPDDPLGQGPGGRTIRSGMPVVCEDVMQDPSFTPWMALAHKYGYRGVISLPLRRKEGTFGLLGLHIKEVRAVTDQEIRLLQEVADNLAFGIDTIRVKKERRRIETAITKVAAGVSGSTSTEFFDQLARNMAEALGAQAGFVARYLAGPPLTVRIIGAVSGDKVMKGFDFFAEGTPCNDVAFMEDYIVPDSVNAFFSHVPELAEVGARAYAGRRLDSSAGQPLGVIFVLFRQPIERKELIGSTLQIFAARAAAEIERQDADARIRAQASLLDKAQDAIIVCGIDQRISFWNKGAERLYGWTAEEAIGKTKVELIDGEAAALSNGKKTVMEYGEWRGEIKQRRKDGTKLVVEAHWTLVRDEHGNPQSILAINTDITQRKAAEKEIERLAFFDPLTRLPNRRLLMDRLQHAVTSCRRNRHTGALLFLDLDNFKILNDTLGHDKGDLLLQQVARRLEACVRKSNTVARLGGDEFVIMLDDLSENPHEAAAQAEIVGEKVLAAFTAPFQLNEAEHHTSPSIGVTLFNDPASSVDELLKRADLAMYQAKASGRNGIRFFDPEMQNIVTARMALESDFRHGLQQHEFELHYQAQTDGYGNVRGVEALVRWQHAKRGLVDPGAFIPLAEETGLIMRLGHWVLETACYQLANWAAHPNTAYLSIAVNVSARQFHHPSFVDHVLGILRYTGANPKNLKLELTESMLVKNVDDTIAKMHALKAHGIGLSLDDFGTGYSSLSYLKRFPLDQLKIDQSFVKDVLTDSNDAAIARTIVALGQILGLEVIAEGVETEDQRDFLAQHGCHAYQGFLFSHPVPAEQFQRSYLMH